MSSLVLTPVAQRLLLLHAAQADPTLQQLLLEACRRRIRFWINVFCWTFDPRRDQPHCPFRLYPFQERFLRDLCAAIERGEDLLVEKSRDMGVSWLTLLTFQYYWLFRDGSQFLIGSRKAALVDQKGDISSLMQKCRYNLSRLPLWMRPGGAVEADAPDEMRLMRLLNPHNGNALMGESSNAQFGRGGRYKAILMDEFPFWPFDDAAFAAAGQSSPCRIVVGTPYGKRNRFAQLRHSSAIRVRTLHWRLHPERDDQWYHRQQARMSPEEIARELDISYRVSVNRRVFSGFDPRHIRDAIAPAPNRRILRSWDFGYHYPACLFAQFDDKDRLRVLHEVIGHDELLVDFARRAMAEGEARFGPDAVYEDICDPAGRQRNDRADRTSIEILNSLGAFPHWTQGPIQDSVELLRMQLARSIEQTPALLIARHCRALIEAFEGGYRYADENEATQGKPGRTDRIVEEHPYEDAMDCLRYIARAKLRVPSPVSSQRRKAIVMRRGRRDPYTAY